MAFIPCNIGDGESSTPITPSNSSPVALTADTAVKPTANGYAIASYSHITPSNSSPVTLSTNIYQSGGSGYAIRSYSSITPSNSSPVSLDSGSIYKASASGYAISSYSSVTPSSTQTAVSSGDIVKIGGSGVIVDTVPPTPTSITPSNSNPVPMYENTAYEPTVRGIAIADFINAVPSNSSPQTLVSGNIYKSQGNGYGIESYSSITPSNSSPVSLTSGSFYKPSASGYAISSYSSKTPSDTSPASVSSGAIIKASSAGYLVKNKPVDLGVPDLVSQVDMAASASRSITVTSKPKVVVLIESQRGSDGAQFLQIYDSVKDKYTTATYTAGGGYAHSDGTGLPGRITTVSTTTVTVKNASTGYAVRSSVLIYY